MTKACFTALLLLLAVPAMAPAIAAEPAAAAPFDAAQRAAIVGIVRDALKADPTILRDALAAMQADDTRLQEAAARVAVNSSHSALTEQPTDPQEGNPAGDVTLVEFYDVRCPYCRSMLPTMAQLLAQDRGIRLVLKDLPILGPGSVLGARALLAAQRQGGYTKLQAAIMQGPADVNEASLRSQAQSVGLDWARLQHDMVDPSIQERLNANLALAQALHIEGTPAIIIGEKMIPGAVQLAELQQAVAQVRRGN
jgi:protein-disulfide isomerase